MSTLIQNAPGAQAAAPAASPAAKPVTTMQGYITKMKGEIAKALPSVMTPERFTRIVFSALSTTPALAECTPSSFLGAMMTSAQLGLEVNTPLGQAYLIPRNNRRAGTKECQFQIGYKGLIDLAYRSGQVSTIGAYTVYQNDRFRYSLGLNPELVHEPTMQDRGDPVAFYAVVRLKDGGYNFAVMSVEDVRKHAAKYSESYKGGYSSPWATNFEEMAMKTVLKRALKYAPMATDFVRAMSTDETVKTEIAEDMTVVPPTVSAEAAITDPETGEVVKSPEQAAE